MKPIIIKYKRILSPFNNKVKNKVLTFNIIYKLSLIKKKNLKNSNSTLKN